jgi:hypothetical protein
VSASSVSQSIKSLSLSPSQSQLNALAEWLKVEAPTSLYGTSWEFESHASDAEGTGVRAAKQLAKDELFMRSARHHNHT